MLGDIAQDYEVLIHFTPTAEQRRQFASSGAAMPDGSFYIRNRGDLQNAIRAVGRATPNAGESDVARRNAVRRHIIKRAKALGLTDMIPDTWNSDGTLKQSAILAEEVEEFLSHFGVLGMRWGVRRSDGGGISHPMSSDAATARALELQVKRSGTQSLSNADLQTLVTRLNLERQYSNLNPAHVSAGRKFANEVLRESGKQIATQFIVKNAPKGIAWLAGKGIQKVRKPQ